MTRKTRDLLLVLALLGFGLWSALWWGPQLIAEAKSTADWPVVRGEIDSATVFGTTGRQRNFPFEVRTVYTYEVNGNRYRGTRHNAAGHLRARSRAEADAFARERATGTPVDVRYDPRDPESSVLAVTGVRRGWMRTGFGGVLVLAGLVVGVRRLRNG